MPTLDIYRSGKLLRQRVLANSELVVLGRAASCDVVLSDRERRVSRSHAALIPLQQPSADFFIRDLGSLYGTRVNGASIDQKVLKDHDIIEIAGYRLVFSSRSGMTANFRHLSLVSPKRVSGCRTSAALTFKTARSFNGLPLDPPKDELLEEVQRRAAGGEVFSDFASDIVPAVLRVVRAEKGFIGLFPDDGSKMHSECGVVNLRQEETIEVSDADFEDHLAKGEVVQEGSALLVPIGRPREVAGFFCIKAGRNRAPFSREDMAFLLALGRLAPSAAFKARSQPRSSRRANEIYPWPVGIVGKSEEITGLLGSIQNAALSDLNVMVLGETGTGKELVTQAIHQRSRNSRGPFIARNCSQITESLAEAEIFGYGPQSGIAGANPKGSAGWFELANGGTLFLDEVHSLPPTLQDKFLRVLQEKEVWRIGASSPVHVSVKVVAATDEDPEKALKSGWFRAPFLYRFGATIHVPPLRARTDDIPLLAFYFLDRHASALRSRTRSISHRALRLLVESDWPGNIRQLEQQIQLAVARDQEVLFSWDFGTPTHPVGPEPGSGLYNPILGDEPQEMTTDTPKTMDEVEKHYIKEVLEAAKGNLTKSAHLLGYRSRQTLLNKMDRYRIPRNYAARMKPPGESR
jgi:DNA-binding NtrC family response regulator